MDTGLWIVNSLCGSEMWGGTSTCWFVGRFPWLVSVSLENALRKFACLTTGDMIAINYNDRVFCSLSSWNLILYSITGCLRWKNYMTVSFSMHLSNCFPICWSVELKAVMESCHWCERKLLPPLWALWLWRLQEKVRSVSVRMWYKTTRSELTS